MPCVAFYGACGYITAPMRSENTTTVGSGSSVSSLLAWAVHQLSVHGCDEPRVNAELLLAHVLGISRLDLYDHSERRLHEEELHTFGSLLGRRTAREPLQYIIGETSFMGIPLALTADVLIPRPETETLVEHVLAFIRTLSMDPVAVLDIGSGAGNIPIALAMFSPNVVVDSIDISEPALEVARRNARRNRTDRVSFHHADVFGQVLDDRLFDVIVANPPYVSGADFGALQPEVREHEPRMALTDEADGLTIIRRVISLAVTRLRRGGAVFVEIGHGQAAEVLSLAQDAGFERCVIHRDYQGIERILDARKV